MIEPQSFHKILNQSISASKNGLSSIIESFDTPLPPSVSGPILSPSNGSPVEQSTKRITLCPFESLVNCDGQRPSVGTDYDRNRVRVAVTSWKFRSVGPRESLGYISCGSETEDRVQT